MTDIIRLTAGDFQDGMDFLNLVFGTHGPHDFEQMLPALYQPTEEWTSCNYAVREEGRIKGIVGLFPFIWRVGEARFKVGGIGGVSTHPKSRGAGHMKALMSHCVGVMKEEGYHLSYLGGQRQRYQYFGYERCGSASSFNLNKSNLRHCFKDDPGIRFEPLKAEDEERLIQTRKLHDAQPAHCIRSPENFYKRLRSWNQKPFAAFDVDDCMVGYLTASGSGDEIGELAARDDGIALCMLRAWVAGHSEYGTRVNLPAWRGDLARALGKCCERFDVHATGTWEVFDWVAVLDALMKVRRLGGPLLGGAVVVGIEKYGSVRLRVEGDNAGCAMTNEAPAVQCDALTAMRLLFGPLSPSQVLELPAEASLLEQWCPLPLYWPSQDGV